MSPAAPVALVMCVVAVLAVVALVMRVVAVSAPVALVMRVLAVSAVVALRVSAFGVTAALFLAQRPASLAYDSIAAPVEAALDAVAPAVEPVRELPMTARRRDEGEQVEVSVDSLASPLEPSIPDARVA